MRQRSQKQERAARAERLRAEGWTWEEIAAEFRRLEPASALLSLRWAHGRSQDEIARDYNRLLSPGEKPVTFHTVSEWEQWPDAGRPPPLVALNRLARIYQTTAAALFDGEDHRLLDEAYQRRPAPAGGVQELRGAAGPDGPPAPTALATVIPTAPLINGLLLDRSIHLDVPGHTGLGAGEDTIILLICGRDPMDRRLYIKSNLVLPGVVVLGGPITGILDPDAQSTLATAWISSGKVGPEVLDPFRTLLAGCRRLDDILGARHLIEPAAGLIRMAAQILPSATAEARKPLLSLAGEAAQFGGYLAMESGNHAQARQYHAQALEWAAAADDRTLAAYVWSRQSVEARWAGDAPRAVSAVEAARTQAADAPAAVRAWIEKDACVCYAFAGNRDETDRAFDDAATLLDGADRSEDPDWIYFASPEILTAERGFAYNELGRGAEALKVFSIALDALPSTFVRDRGHFLAAQANAYRLIGAIDDACEIGIQVVELARQTGSIRMLGKVQDLQAALTDAQQQVPEARLLHDMLQEAKPST